MAHYARLSVILFTFASVLSGSAFGEPFWAPRSFDLSREVRDQGKVAKFEHGVVQFAGINRFSFVSKSAEARENGIAANYFEQTATADGCFRIYANLEATGDMPATIAELSDLFAKSDYKGTLRVLFSEDQQGLEFAKAALSSLFVYTDFELIYPESDLGEIGFPAAGTLKKSEGSLSYATNEAGKQKVYTFEEIDGRWALQRFETKESYDLPDDPQPTDDDLFAKPVSPRLREQFIDAAVVSKSKDTMDIVYAVRAEYTSGQKVDSSNRLRLFNIRSDSMPDPRISYPVPDGHEVTLVDSPQIKAWFSNGSVQKAEGLKDSVTRLERSVATNRLQIVALLVTVFVAAAALCRIYFRRSR